MSSESSFDLIVIGSGPGGYIAAIRGSQLGMKVACVEKDPTLGGTCLNVGCIPSKALLDSSEHYDHAKHHLAAHGVKVSGVELDLPAMLKRKDKIVKQLTGGIAYLFRKHKITRFQGLGSLAGDGNVEVTANDGSKQTITGKHILIATGSSPISLPGITLDGDRIGTSTEALAYPEVPKHLIVIGAGVIGLELGSVWARLGAEVTVVEYMPELLPMLDEDVRKVAAKLFPRQGLSFEFGARVTGAALHAEGSEVTVTYEREGRTYQVTGDRLLVAVGRRPNTEGLGADKVGLKLDRRGAIEIDDHFRTNVPGIYAIGDVVRGPMLAHKAEDEGVAAVELIAGQPGHVNYNAIPNVIYTHPEIASVGKTEAELTKEGVPFKTGAFPFAANGRAKALAQTDGLVKIIAHAQNDRVLGVHIIGPRASDVIAEAAVAIEFSACAEDLARSVHGHPTLSEVVKQAALAVAGRATQM